MSRKVEARQAKVFAPATIANVGPGFDVLGLALDQPGDIVVARRKIEPGLSFRLAAEGANAGPPRRTETKAPDDPRKNVAARVAALFLEETKPPFGVDLVLYKRMPIGSGLGSSAASSVAAVVATNALLANPLPKKALLRFAVEGERIASGSPHADNAAASLLGGVCLILDRVSLEVVSLPLRNTMFWVVVHPHVVVKTREARRRLPAMVRLDTAVQQWAHVSGLTAGLALGDVELTGRSIRDVVVEPVRAGLIPGFEDVKRSALGAGATGCSISGSGPSMFAVTGSRAIARAVGAAMAESFRRAARLESEIYISRVNLTGARVLGRGGR